MESDNSQEIRYIFITGGPMSGIGKGIIASTIAMFLSWAGFVVTALKIDGYLNYDAGTMSPYEHGECYVTSDGGEADLDLGNYERFVGLQLSRLHSMSMGKIYDIVRQKERSGAYLGQTVQIVPHITNEIKNWIHSVALQPVSICGQSPKPPQICIVEIGGTVGDMETLPVFHAIKQMRYESSDKYCFVHVSKLSYAGSSDGNCEEKTKPTQHNIEKLRELGVQPDIIIMRCDKECSAATYHKLKIQCMVRHIFSSWNVNSIHQVPDVLYKQGLVNALGDILNLSPIDFVEDVSTFQKYAQHINNTELPIVKIAIVGKYTGMNDTYLSLIRALEHAGFANSCRVKCVWFEADKENINDWLACDGILVPGGFGIRGITGMQKAYQAAVSADMPYFGICLGMQIMVSQIAKKLECVCAESAEWCRNCGHELHAISLLSGQVKDQIGGTMRLGDYECRLEENTLAYKLYGKLLIKERHRHRYEVMSSIDLGNAVISGRNPQYGLPEIVEIPDKKFILGCQFHPEFRSRYFEPHPLFVGFIAAAYMRMNSIENN